MNRKRNKIDIKKSKFVSNDSYRFSLPFSFLFIPILWIWKLSSSPASYFYFFSEQNQVKFHWEIHTYITIHNGRQILGVCTSFSTLIETCKTKLKWIKKNQNSFFSLSSFVSFRRKKNNNKPSRSSSFFSSISLCCCYSMLNKE